MFGRCERDANVRRCTAVIAAGHANLVSAVVRPRKATGSIRRDRPYTTRRAARRPCPLSDRGLQEALDATAAGALPNLAIADSVVDASSDGDVAAPLVVDTVNSCQGHQVAARQALKSARRSEATATPRQKARAASHDERKLWVRLVS